ncbi:M23 family metallopeptidase [Candidatus Peregrinibacteria bacterium]|nr:M23 family metallopeptidase [Candidatus Peregrinibacteria bacterium]
MNKKIFAGMIFAAIFLAIGQTQAKVIFTDMLYDNYKSGWGTTALFDLDSAAGSTKDICGSLNGSWYMGRAYDNHHGWDRDIPNDGGSYVVFAAASGIVETVKDGCYDGDKECNNKAGNYIVINHGSGVTTHYFHAKLGTFLVKQDQWVDRYAPLFIGNNTGQSTGEHIHFEVRINGKSVDPLGTSVGWIVKPIIDLGKCPYSSNNQTAYYLVNPYTLKEYADDTINKAAILYSPEELGQIAKNTYWIASSNGFNPKDFLIRIYQAGTLYSSMIFVFDLANNAPKAFKIPSPIAEEWMNIAMSDSVFGKPITDPYPISSGVEIDFQGGYFTHNTASGAIAKSYYKEKFGPGMFDSGWLAGKSYAISECYEKNGAREKVGEPHKKFFSLAKTAAVHIWEEYFVQDFDNGIYGECAIMLHDHGSNKFDAHLMKGKIWSTYHSIGKGPSYFGAPISDEYKDVALGIIRQDFEKGMSILGNGLIVWQNTNCDVDGKLDIPQLNAPCDCPGEITAVKCENCGLQKLICTNYMWKAPYGCENKGQCDAGKSEEKSCTKYTCAGTTKRQCDQNCKWSEWSECAVTSSQEICDNMDNDCDGQTDENLVNSCSTACGTGTAECEGGMWTKCTAQLPVNEICDNKDNNCDGQIDENLTQTCSTQCGSGTSKCMNGKWTECDAAKPVNEICDNKDNNCDGQIDENLTQTCVSDCGIGKQKCNSGKWSACDALQPNVCGGCTSLAYQPGTPCGSNGTYVCEGKDNVKCSEPPKNACGGSSTLPHQPGEKCGTNGTYACKGTDAIECKEQFVNACGGTSTLPYNPGDSCGKCGHYECNGSNSVKCTAEGICTPGQTQSCSGACGSGQKICDSNCQWGPCDASGGECASGQTQTEPCGGNGYCKAGTHTRTCVNCTWGEWSNCSSGVYGFDTKTHCGNVICITITSASAFSATAKITKVEGKLFTSNPIEWFLMDKTLNKVLAHAPGFGCDTYYTGQKEIIVNFNPSQYNIALDEIQAEVYSGGYCEAQYLSGITYLQKCN